METKTRIKSILYLALWFITCFAAIASTVLAIEQFSRRLKLRAQEEFPFPEEGDTMIVDDGYSVGFYRIDGCRVMRIKDLWASEEYFAVQCDRFEAPECVRFGSDGKRERIPCEKVLSKGDCTDCRL